MPLVASVTRATAAGSPARNETTALVSSSNLPFIGIDLFAAFFYCLHHLRRIFFGDNPRERSESIARCFGCFRGLHVDDELLICLKIYRLVEDNYPAVKMSGHSCHSCHRRRPPTHYSSVSIGRERGLIRSAMGNRRFGQSFNRLLERLVVDRFGQVL